MKQQFCSMSIMLFMILLLLGKTYQKRFRYTDQCPVSSISRIYRSEMLNCTWKNPINSYHCLPTDGDRPVEMCHQDTVLQADGGCPYITIEGGEVHIRQKKCNEKGSRCPLTMDTEIVSSSQAYLLQNCSLKTQESISTLKSADTVNASYDGFEFIVSLGTQIATPIEGLKDVKENAVDEDFLLKNHILLIGTGCVLPILAGCIFMTLKKSSKTDTNKSLTERMFYKTEDHEYTGLDISECINNEDEKNSPQFQTNFIVCPYCRLQRSYFNES